MDICAPCVKAVLVSGAGSILFLSPPCLDGAWLDSVSRALFGFGLSQVCLMSISFICVQTWYVLHAGRRRSSLKDGWMRPLSLSLTTVLQSSLLCLYGKIYLACLLSGLRDCCMPS